MSNPWLFESEPWFRQGSGVDQHLAHAAKEATANYTAAQKK
jgi:hypothetical protein